MKIAVSGSNGFLGSIIARRLHRDGHEVHAMMRKGSSDKYIKNSCTQLHKIDYFNEEEVKSVLKGIDVFVHVAGLSKDWGKFSDFYNTNVFLAQKIHRIAIEADVKKCIHISSNSVLGEEDCKVPKNESSPYKAKHEYFLEIVAPSAMNSYKISKEFGEISVAEIHNKNNTNLTILRPVWIFGPREFSSGPYEYCKTVESGIPFLPGTKKNLFHTVYVEDVASAVVKSIDNAPDGINYYNIGPKEVKTMHNFYGTFCRFIKRKKPINIPSFILLLPVTILEFAYITLRIKTPPLLTRARLYMMYANNIYDVSKAEVEIGFVADTDIEQAVRKTVKWWKLNKFL